MARLRLLLALCLIAVGTTFGALALSGYYNPNVPARQLNVASIDAKAGAHLARTKPRQRFVTASVADAPAPTQAALTPPKPKLVKSAAPEAKPQDAKKAKDKPKDKRQQAALSWPWNLFSN
jgi:hypothetical protein